ncbi:hypothetical protein [Flavihumibacter profundi]|uniref:hypothetical protein n=1 Tax=Flavihumibacter profundi TaxID=2716883 RepID=UPI001CC72469|nr:hypothetical protein [Flavihumibacter profundi]MBZ5855832.1 hypothetical protein [Flavihumibacter profundi]
MKQQLLRFSMLLCMLAIYSTSCQSKEFCTLTGPGYLQTKSAVISAEENPAVRVTPESALTFLLSI